MRPSHCSQCCYFLFFALVCRVTFVTLWPIWLWFTHLISEFTIDSVWKMKGLFWPPHNFQIARDCKGQEAPFPCSTSVFKTAICQAGKQTQLQKMSPPTGGSKLCVFVGYRSVPDSSARDLHSSRVAGISCGSHKTSRNCVWDDRQLLSLESLQRWMYHTTNMFICITVLGFD